MRFLPGPRLPLQGGSDVMTARHVAASLVTAVLLLSSAIAQDVRLPRRDKSTRFAVLGDTGTGDRQQREVGVKVEEYRKKTNFSFAIMLGDNIYGSERPQD